MTYLQPELTDVCARRHGGNPESASAFRSIVRTLPAARSRVLAEIQRAGSHGLTAKELAGNWGVGMNVISGRFSELKRDQLIRKTGSRECSGVYVWTGGAP